MVSTLESNYNIYYTLPLINVLHVRYKYLYVLSEPSTIYPAVLLLDGLEVDLGAGHDQADEGVVLKVHAEVRKSDIQL